MKKHLDTKVAALGACAALILGFAACSSSNSTDVPTTGQGASTATGGNAGTGGQAATGCPGSQLECNKQCFDGNVDPTNCGSCGTACSAGEVCNAGSCALSCSPGTSDCSGGCVDQNVDPNNCGACDKACAGGEVCSAGVCTTTCAAGLIVCNGKCTDPLTDKGYCGAAGDCTTAASGGSGGTGGAGGASGGTGGAAGGAGGAGAAGGAGGAGGAAPPANSAGEVCTGDDVCNGSGVCELRCQTGFIDCNGTCTDPNSNQLYCGASGDCQGANDGDICSAGEICNGSGVCQLSCQSGLLDCNGTCIDPNSNPTYCGASSNCQGANDGNVCAAGTEACVSGTCAPLEVDPCVNYGGTDVEVSANIRVCTTPQTWGAWNPAQIVGGWRVCTLAQWQAYAPSATPSSLGLKSLWIDGPSCGTGTSHREIYLSYPMNQVSCYDGSTCCWQNTRNLQFAICR